jgi:hypothetical protein
MVSLLTIQSSFGFERERISLASESHRNLFLQKQYTVRVVAQKYGPIATIFSNAMRSSIKYHFQLFKAHDPSSVDSQAAFKNLKNLRDFTDVFGPIGFPQMAMLTAWDGVVYGLVMVTKVDLPPEKLFYIETDDPKVAEEFYNSQRVRSGVGGGFGGQLGGAYTPFSIDAAILVRFDSDRPVIMKVYDLIHSEDGTEGFDTSWRLQDVISEYAYSDFRKFMMADASHCDRHL